MDVTDVDDLKRSLTAGRWPRRIGGFSRREIYRILCHIWIIAKTKNGRAEKDCSRGWNVHVAEIVRQNRPFKRDRSLADILVLDLKRH
jgi:hypothetical protein